MERFSSSHSIGSGVGICSKDWPGVATLEEMSFALESSSPGSRITGIGMSSSEHSSSNIVDILLRRILFSSGGISGGNTSGFSSIISSHSDGRPWNNCLDES